MENFNRKDHWENIYQTRKFEEVSWYQKVPSTSLALLKELDIDKAAKIIDVGGGDSYFVDHLLEANYTDITVLDISNSAIERSKKRLGAKAEKVKWIVADASDFESKEQYDFWHDRAAFHFLTKESEVENYAQTAHQSILPKGILVIGTFSDQGPKKCSGIEIQQYSEESMTNRFNTDFDKINCFTLNHETPFDTTQNFIFCSFRKK